MHAVISGSTSVDTIDLEVKCGLKFARSKVGKAILRSDIEALRGGTTHEDNVHDILVRSIFVLFSPVEFSGTNLANITAETAWSSGLKPRLSEIRVFEERGIVAFR